VYFLALGTLLIVCVGCASDGQQVFHKNEYHAPPAAMMEHPGPMVGGPGPGVMMASHQAPAGPACPPGVMPMPGAAMMPPMMPPMGPPAVSRTSQVRFLGPEGMVIGWQIGPSFAENQLIAPARYNFAQAATYRLKFSNIP